MHYRQGLFALITCMATLASSGSTVAQDVKPIDPSRFYKGVWLEVARRPMWITDGCVVGTTQYTRGAQPNEVRVRDACRKAGPSGAETVLEGVAEILDPGVNRKLEVQYNPLLRVRYDIVDYAKDYSWFIGTSSTLDNLFIYTRRPPSKARLRALVNRARGLGYDTSTLEFPWGPAN
jgi:apolipoprotein D and lipocalin family protein